MKSRTTRLRTGGLLIAAALVATAAVAAPPAASTMKQSELVTLSGEVTAVDLANRSVTLRGPLGGEVMGKVSDEVKNLDQVKVGDLVSIAFYQSMAVSAKRKGETNLIFSGDSGSADKGDMPAGYVGKQKTQTVTVVSVDAEAKSLVVQGPRGELTAVAVKRPEFAAKLADLKEGDQLEVVTTEAFIVSVDRGTGVKPSMSSFVSTVVVDNGEVVRRMNNTIFVRNDKGKIVKIVVDPKFKFMLDGKEATVTDLKPGAKLKRTSFRVIEDVEYEAQ